jgi:LemA protein
VKKRSTRGKGLPQKMFAFLVTKCSLPAKTMNQSEGNDCTSSIRISKVAALVAIFVFVFFAKPAVGGVLPPDWQVTGLGNGGRLVTDATVEYDSGTWNIKTGPSRSAIIYKNFNGDVSTVLEITDATGQANAHIGIMMWSSLAPTAGKAGLVLDPQGQHLYFSWDEASDRPQLYGNYIQCEGIGFPVWLKLTRSGSYFLASYSKDGKEWHSIGVPIKTFWAGQRPELFAGIYADGVCEERVTHLQATPAPATTTPESLPNNWNVDIHGEPDYAGQAKYADGKWILAGANTSGRGGYHNVSVLKPVPSETELVVKIQTSDLSDPRSGGGLLLSAHGLDVGIMAFPSGGTLAFFTRQAIDGRTLQNRNVPIPSAMMGQAGAFLRLALVDGKIAAFYGTDTNNWIQVGETPPFNEMAADVTGGMELYSVSDSHFASTVSFDGFQASSITAPKQEARSNPIPAWMVQKQGFRPSYIYWPGYGQKPSDAKFFSTWDDFHKRDAEMTGQSNPPTPTQPSTPQPAMKLASSHPLIGLLVWGIVILIVGAIFCIIKPFNRLVYLRNRTRKAWAQIDVQLKRRYDLVYKYIEVVKEYAKHESSTLENVTRARAAAMNAVSIQERARAEAALNVKMKSLYAVAEAYPDLKANQNFLALQQSLTNTEDMLAAVRGAYNEEVLTYNTAVQSFPTNLVAFVFRFKERAFFEMEEAEQREAPNEGIRRDQPRGL